MKELLLHPLLSTKDGELKNNHYKRPDGRQSIQDIEDENSVNEVIAWCQINMRKYALRAKNQDEEDLAKIISYGSYKDELILLKLLGLGEMLVTNAWSTSHKEWRYQ